MIAQSMAEILAEHVKLSIEAIDRLYLNVYVPRLQTEQGIVWFFRNHRGQPAPSAALMSPMGQRFIAALEAFAAKHGLPLVLRQTSLDIMAWWDKGLAWRAWEADYERRHRPRCLLPFGNVLAKMAIWHEAERRGERLGGENGAAYPD
jgi:hypothetical protein